MPGRGYAILERDDVALHLFQDNAKSHSPVGIHIFRHEVEELHEEIAERGARVSQEIIQKPWGNEIKFTEPLLETA